METWIDEMKTAWVNGNKPQALKIAARFKSLGKHKDAIILAKECYIHPSFYKSIGKDIDKCLELGYSAIAEHFEL